MTVIFADKHITVCVKSAGELSEDMPNKKGLPSIIKEELSLDYVGTVHRLDRETSGLMVYANTPDAAAELSRQIASGEFGKEYFAVVSGEPDKPSGIWQDLLFRDAKRNRSFVVKRERKGVRRASLEYEVIKSNGELSLMRFILHTGRTHQIRVQSASRGMSVAGDRKYGSKLEGQLALMSCALKFKHPKTKKPMTFTLPLPSGSPWNF